MPIQDYNDQNADLLATIFQRRYEANFATVKTLAAGQSLASLRAFWPGGSSESNAVDDLSGQGRHLYISGPTLVQSSLVQYVNFDGINDYLIRPDEDGLRITAGLSMAGWFYFGAGSAIQGLTGKWYETGNDRGYVLRRTAADKIQAVISTNGTNEYGVTTADAVSNSTWYFLGLRFESSTALSVCVNRTWTDETAATPAAIYAATENFNIGRQNRTNYLTGRAAFCWVAAAALPKAAFAVMYEAGRALFGV